MTQIRVEETYDGVCTVFVGHQVIVEGLNRLEADRLAEAFRRRSELPLTHAGPRHRG